MTVIEDAFNITKLWVTRRSVHVRLGETDANPKMDKRFSAKNKATVVFSHAKQISRTVSGFRSYEKVRFWHSNISLILVGLSHISHPFK